MHRPHAAAVQRGSRVFEQANTIAKHGVFTFIIAGQDATNKVDGIHYRFEPYANATE